MTNPQNPGGWPDAAMLSYPENPERDGWHWLHHRIESKPQPVQWIAEIYAWASGAAYSPEGVVELGWRYLGPCLTPAEVEARVAAARREGIEMAAAYCDGRQRVYGEQAIAALDRDGFDQHDISLASTLMASAFENAAAAIRALQEDKR